MKRLRILCISETGWFDTGWNPEWMDRRFAGAMYFLTQTKNNVSALERLIGVCYRSAWRRKHKVLQVVFSPRRDFPSRGSQELG